MALRKGKSEATKLQIRTWIEKAIEEARSPDPRAVILRERKQKAKRVVKQYGF